MHVDYLQVHHRSLPQGGINDCKGVKCPFTTPNKYDFKLVGNCLRHMYNRGLVYY